MNLLDTCILIDVANGDRSVIKRLEEFARPGIRPAITTATYSEYYFGFLSRIPEDQNKCLEFLEEFTSLTLTKASARRLAELNFKYKKAGLTFSTMDLLNAAIAIEENMVFVTTDRQFEN